MTFEDRGYQITVIANLPDTDSYTATKMWMRDLAITKREAARYNRSVGFKFAAESLEDEANKISEALEVLNNA